ncbi:MAG: septal ring lytic transglycosylase RlpA family protein [Cyclobacteriaceae bacterium]|nr:septal ring lytic transglycosylase RlpA family protein [Cyclobacteriaceae bacterium]
MIKIICSALLLLPFLASGQVQEGKASFYADKFEGKPTASGEKYRHNQATAAHKTLPFGTKVKVTNLANNKTVVVRVNDRGPFVEGRIIDLSKSAAETLGFVQQGLANVKIEVVDPGDGKGGGGSGQAQPIGNVRVEERELYNFEVSKASAAGFGVQIGSYQELVNLVHIAENLKSSYKKNVTVQVKVLNGVKIYTLILGKFPSRDKAEAYKKNVTGKYPDAFIVDFSTLK